MILPSSVRDVVRRNYGTWRGLIRHALGLAELGLGRLAPLRTYDIAKTSRLVFVCLGNINRSAYACALARSLGDTAVSLGLSTTTGASATPEAQAESLCRGIDLCEHKALAFADHRAQSGDLYLVMEVRHAKRLMKLGVPPASIALLGLWAHPARVHIHDPHTLSTEYFRTCFTLIESAVRSLIEQRKGLRP